MNINVKNRDTWVLNGNGFAIAKESGEANLHTLVTSLHQMGLIVMDTQQIYCMIWYMRNQVK